mmetsp:Transcript_32630/g.79395  ORF Transcript_32630/g.79395 Transcript_32630/m.79395 type:complete len:173 (-) Transcript_32630:718-1236(-)
MSSQSPPAIEHGQPREPRDIEPEQKAPGGEATSDDPGSVPLEMTKTVPSKLFPTVRGKAAAWRYLRRMRENHYGRKSAPTKNFQCVYPIGDGAGRICGRLIYLRENNSPVGFDIQVGTRHCGRDHNMATKRRKRRIEEDARAMASVANFFPRASKRERRVLAEADMRTAMVR